MNDVPRCKMCVLSRWNRVSKKKRWTSIWPKYMKTSRAASSCVLPCPGFGTAVFPNHVNSEWRKRRFLTGIYTYSYISIYLCFVPFSLIWFPTEMLRTTANSRLFDPHTLTGSMYDIHVYIYMYTCTYIDLPFKNQKSFKHQPCHVGKICHISPFLHFPAEDRGYQWSEGPTYHAHHTYHEGRSGRGPLDRTSTWPGPGWLKQAMLHSGYGNR